MINRYQGQCCECHKPVAAGAGELEETSGGYFRGRRRKFRLWCSDCYGKKDHSGAEDRCCGDRAYEDACAAAVGDSGGY